MTDWDLLRKYRDEKSNEAFRQLADRHMRLVYSTCRRDLANVQAAEDATQIVFILLARKAGSIARGTSIASWLFSTARFVCKDMIRTEMRRRRREEAIQTMEAHAENYSEWNRVEPLLNDALTSLTASDREAVLMRYYTGMSLAEIAAQIGTTENTARKRVDRAVGRLRRYFQREPAAGQLLSLDVLLLAYAAGSVPQHTQSSVMTTLQNLGAAHAASAGAGAHAGALLKKGAIALMDASTKKVVAGIAVAVVICAGFGIYSLMAHFQGQRSTPNDMAELVDAASGAGQSQAPDRAQIVEELRDNLEGYRRRDLSHWNDNYDPGMVVTSPGQPNITFPKLVQQQQSSYRMLGPFSVIETIQALRINGNTAQVQLATHFTGTTVHYILMPGGLAMVDDETLTDTLRKENGRWLIARTDVQTMRTSIGGHVVFQLPKPG